MIESEKEENGLDLKGCSTIIGVTLAVCALCFVIGIVVGMNIFK